MRKTRKTGASVGLDWAAAAIAPPPPDGAPARSRSGWRRDDAVVCEGCGFKFSPRAFALHRLAPGTFVGQVEEVCVPEVELDSIGLFCFNRDRAPLWFGTSPAHVQGAWERFCADLKGGSATPWQIAACRPVLGLPGTLLELARALHAWAGARAARSPPEASAQCADSMCTVLGDTDHLLRSPGPGDAGPG